MQMKKKTAKNVMQLLSNAQETTMPPQLQAKAGAGMVTPNKVPDYRKNPTKFQKRVAKAIHG